MGLIVWEGLSAFEHVQCTLLAHGLPLVKSSLPCLSLCLGSQSSCVLFFFFSLFVYFFPLYSVLPLYVGLHVLAVCSLHSFECDICASPAVKDV